MNNIIKKEKFKLSLLIIMYMFLCCFFFNIFKFLKILNCLVLVEVISVIFPVLYYFLSNKERSRKNIITICIYLFLILIVPFLFGKTYDLTVDGNSYHKTAIGFIKDGWNPIYESSSTFNSSIDEDIGIVSLWIDHYPKGTYFIESVIYSLTNNIESGKCITLLANISLCLLIISILEEKINNKVAIFIGILSFLNPIVLSQIFTFYVDGLMGICFALEILLLILINPNEKSVTPLFVYLLSVIGIFVNIKFTGLLYSGIIAAVYYIYWIIKNLKNNKKWEIYRKMTIKFSIIFVIAIGIIGSSSYIKNTIDHKNPLYPLIGKDKVDIITTEQPDNFNNLNSFEKFVISLFSKTENKGANMGSTTLKNPLRVYRSEIESLSLPDTRIGGFGPYFGLAIILSLIAIILLNKNLGNYLKNNKKVLLLVIALVLSIILIGEGWWARYVPQFYYLIVLIIYLNYILNKKKISKIINFLLILVLIVNSGFFIVNYKESLETYKSVSNDLALLYNKSDIELCLTDESNFGLYYNLKDKKINYIKNKNLTDENSIYLYSWRIKVKE